MFELDLLRLRQGERPGDVSEGFVGEDDRAGRYGAHTPDEMHVFDGSGEKLQSAAILRDEPQARAIQVTVNQ